MTVRPGDAELLDAQLAFHLNAGVDLVIAPSEVADDVVRETLERYHRWGQLVRMADAGGSLTDTAAVARFAAIEHSADWLIDAHSNEFWWPRGANLGEVLVAVPPRYGAVRALVRDFLPRGAEGAFAERMTVRTSLLHGPAGDEPLVELLRPIHRLQPGIGAHQGQPLRAWYPIEVFRFPIESSTERHDPVSDAAITRGLEEGTLALDERLRDALRVLCTGSRYAVQTDGSSLLTFPMPSIVDDAEYAVECAAVGEVDLDRIDTQIRDLEERLVSLEQRLWPRVLRTASRLSRGLIRARG